MKKSELEIVPEIKIVSFKELHQDPKVLCELIYETLPSFYELIPGDRDRKFAVILAQLKSPKTELSPTWVALVNGEIAGYISFFLSDELAARQFNGAMTALGMLSSTERATYLAALQKHTSGHPPLPPNCVYMARLAVSVPYFSLGVSAHLLNFGLDSFKETGRYTAYIARENVRSQKFSEKFGFRKSVQLNDADTYLYAKGVSEALSASG